MEPDVILLWRNVIPHNGDLGHCLAPDLVGMGQSAPSPDGAYRFREHARYLDAWFDALDIRNNVTLVLHDWGSALAFAGPHGTPNASGPSLMESILYPREWEDVPQGRAPIFRDLTVAALR